MGKVVNETIAALNSVAGKEIKHANVSQCWGPKRWDTTLIEITFTDGTSLEIGSDGMSLEKTTYLWAELGA